VCGEPAPKRDGNVSVGEQRADIVDGSGNRRGKQSTRLGRAERIGSTDAVGLLTRLRGPPGLWCAVLK
jgi:hypothetical protein